MDKKLNVLIINLKSSLERRKRITEQLDNLNIPYTFLEATEGSSLTNSWIENNVGDRLKGIYFNNEHHLITKNSLACADSHRRAQKIASEFKNGYTLILEDDVELARDFKQKVHNVVDLMHSNSMEVAFLGYNLARGNCNKLFEVKKSSTKFSFFKYPVDGHVSGAYAYLVSTTGAKKLVKCNIEKIQYMADTFLIREKNLSSSTVLLYPKMVTTGYFESNIGYPTSTTSITKKIKLKITHSRFLKSSIGYYLLRSWKERRW